MSGVEFVPSPDSNPTDDEGFQNADDLLGNVSGSSARISYCEECGATIENAAKGALRKFCDVHRKQPTKAKSTKSIDTLVAQMTDLYRTTGMAVSFLPSATTDGMTITANAETLAQSWVPLMERDPKVRKAWERLCTGGGWGTVLMAHGMVAISIMQAHDVKIPGLTNHNPIGAEQ